MDTMPKRDITGNCEGECRDRVLEGQEERQNEILADGLDYEDHFPRAKWADDRDIQPGVFGGHI